MDFTAIRNTGRVESKRKKQREGRILSLPLSQLKKKIKPGIRKSLDGETSQIILTAFMFERAGWWGEEEEKRVSFPSAYFILLHSLMNKKTLLSQPSVAWRQTGGDGPYKTITSLANGLEYVSGSRTQSCELAWYEHVFSLSSATYRLQ